MTEEKAVVIVLDRQRFHKRLNEFSADTYDQAANYVLESSAITREELADGLRLIATLLREKEV